MCVSACLCVCVPSVCVSCLLSMIEDKTSGEIREERRGGGGGAWVGIIREWCANEECMHAGVRAGGSRCV